jgi:hypothetical protein
LAEEAAMRRHLKANLGVIMLSALINDWYYPLKKTERIALMKVKLEEWLMSVVRGFSGQDY